MRRRCRRRCAGCRRRRSAAAVSISTGTRSISAMERGSWRSWRRTRAAVAVVRAALIGSASDGRRRGGGRGARRRLRRWRALASSTRWRKASSTVSVPVRVRRASGVSSARISPSRIRSRRWQRSASSMTWEETRSVAPRSAAMVVEEVPQVAAQDGVEADGGFVEDEEFGGAEEGDGEGDAAALAAGEVAGEGVGVGGEVDVGDGAGDVRRARRSAAARPGSRTRRSSRGSAGRSGRRRRRVPG